MSTNMRCLLSLCFTLTATLLLFASAASAEERILSFHSDIRIEQDGSMLVTETISVRAEGVNIRRGIYREFPTRYRDSLGNAYRVDFDVLGVTRDGQPEPWEAYRRANGVRVDFGDDSFLRVPAEYVYTIQYRTTRQIGFFKDHDELYWNVTGLGWAFVIEQASATVTLPRAVPANRLAMEGYTGPFRARGQDYRASVSDGAGMIRTSKALPPNEGLTLVLSWPKGIVEAPTPVDRARNVVSDNRGVLLALLTLMGACFYLASAWSKVGRDPAPGVIFPHYEPPADCSPATANYVSRMGYHGKALTAAMVDLAVHGHLHIKQQDGKYVLERRQSARTLPVEERTLRDALFSKGDTLELVNRNHAVVNGASHSLSRVLHGAIHGVYYLRNARYLVPSLLGSVVMFVIIVALDAVVPLVVIAFGLIVTLHAVFAWLLKAPTTAGRQLLDKLEGFKLYLDVAEKDEMNLRNPPRMTPELFERYLPYAIALGVEQHWGERFARYLASLQQYEHVRHYHPVWYSGHFDTGHINDFTRNVGHGFSSAIASAATAPGSTSGSGGGGFSGGGGGGGGGGGR